MTRTWLDRLIGQLAPGWETRRLRARLANELVLRHYEGAATSRRTSGWRRSTGDANAIVGPALHSLRESARDLVRNNPYAESALSTIVDHTVGWGIKATPNPMHAEVLKVWNAWAETTACDADGRHDLYGLQKLVKRTVVESGEVLVRRRLRRPEDGLPLPLQLQVLEPDFIDTTKDTSTFVNGRRIINGVEIDALGRRRGYWLYPEHPGSSLSSAASVFVPADSVLHIYKPTRAGQVRAPSWFAPVLLRFKDFDEFEDATLMKQKIAACLAVLYTDQSGNGIRFGAEVEEQPDQDLLSPGLIKGLPAGTNVEVVQPPRTDEYETYSATVLRAIATGLGVTYEDLTGDYTNLPFSAARMSRLRHQARIYDWQWRIMVPQFCEPVWAWAMNAAELVNAFRVSPPGVRWTPPPLPRVDPDKEGIAEQRLIRNGLKPWQFAIREQGYDPEEVAQAMKEDLDLWDQHGIILDCDPRQRTTNGQSATSGASPAAPVPGQATDEDAGGDASSDEAAEGDDGRSWARRRRRLA